MTRIGSSEKEQAVWAQAATLPEFTTVDLAGLGVSEDTARRYCRRWQKSGRIRFRRTDEGNRNVYAPVTSRAVAPGETPPVPTPEGNMWRAMRQVREFCPTDIAAGSNAGGVRVDVKTVQAYCRDLLNAGYLSVRRKARPGLNEAIYRLVRDTGPAAPVVKRVSGVFDPNDETFVPNLKGSAAWQRF